MSPVAKAVVLEAEPLAALVDRVRLQDRSDGTIVTGPFDGHRCLTMCASLEIAFDYDSHVY